MTHYQKLENEIHANENSREEIETNFLILKSTVLMLQMTNYKIKNEKLKKLSSATGIVHLQMNIC